jgi:antitoxin component of MazEF toxin-antitoxin module
LLSKNVAVVRIGGVCQGFILPKFYWESQGLKKGDKLRIEFHEDGTLTVVPINHGSSKTRNRGQSLKLN